ncbi:hypothetical protein DFJ58DRAFT_706146 [Suillus subalutaceus]|uniref:uncharacterized protein n=1 Tax=Suillus subalutaceus TaxID=48586 RepID=UPI001B87B100|nr:uncharacterized protein DFJ58DRAFT_706146 [Suillus subalutaceus]KAG1845505.1 hypothetical protein DFJ58DRAFT_706146 [Suillus subalutaceus]
MGNWVFSVLRYRNVYFAEDHRFDDSSGLGVKVLRSMRRPNAIATHRQVLGEILDGLKTPSHSLAPMKGGEYPPSPFHLRRQRKQLENSNWIDWEWIYEIDLDRNIFHIDGMPFFSLECLPDDEDFIQYISEDHYGHLACASQCPPELKYKRPTPPTVDNSDLATYQSFTCTGSHVALSDLLAISDFLSPNEHIRVSLLEVMVGQCMICPVIGKEIHDIELVSDHNQLTNDQWSIACFVASIAFVPPIFDGILRVNHPELKRKEFTWVRGDTVVCIATHLDDERCLQASVSRLINEIMEQKDNSGDYFGIAFSVYHCALVKVIKDAHTMTFSHTNALQFLPSFYADSPTTAGITALARLGFRIDPALFERVVEICCRKAFLKRSNETEESLGHGVDGSDDMPPNTLCPALPLELWKEIALHLHSLELIPFGLVSKLFREVASMILRYPHLGGYRLVAAPRMTPRYLPDQHLSLRAASFPAARAGIPATVHVGLEEFKDGPSESLITPLRVAGCFLFVHISANS